MLEEFKKFALRGNVVDLAVGSFRRNRNLACGRHHYAGRWCHHRWTRFFKLLRAVVGKGAAGPLLCGREKAGRSCPFRKLYPDVLMM